MSRISVLAMSICFSLIVAKPAQGQEPKFYYCYAPNMANGIVYVSETAQVGPVAERRQYSMRFVTRLIAQNLVPAGTRGYCVMRSSEVEINRGKLDLRTECAECGEANQFHDVAFAGESPAVDRALADINGGQQSIASDSPTPATAANRLHGAPVAVQAPEPQEVVPFEIAAPLPHILTIRLVPRYEGAFVQVHYRFFRCGSAIKVSYSLRPVPSRGVNEIQLNAVVNGNHMKPAHFIATAKTVPGHALGCTSQGHNVGKLADFESQLISGRMLDGTVAWSRAKMIEHLLARFSLFASGAPWPPGSAYAGKIAGRTPKVPAVGPGD